MIASTIQARIVSWFRKNVALNKQTYESLDSAIRH